MRRWRWRLVGTALLVAALAVGTTTATASKDAASATKVRFQLSFFPNAQHVGFLVAANRGYYKQAGLDVKVIPGGPTVNAALSLAQGNSDIAQVDWPEFLQGVAKGAKMTYIGLTYQTDPLVYVALKKTPLSRPRDLKGKRFGVQQVGPLDAEVQALLGRAGLTPKDIKIVSIGFGIEDLLNGKTDVFPSRIFFHPAQFEQAKIKYPSGLNVLDPNKYGVGLATHGLAVNDEFLEENRAAVVTFLRASLRGWRAAIANQKAAVKDVGKFAPPGASNPFIDRIGVANTVKIVTHSANGKPYKKILQIDRAFLTKTQNLLFTYKIVKKKFPLSEVIDTSLMAQAAGS